MVVISETSDDSNGNNPNKNLKELQKEPKQVKNKKLKEKVLYSLPIPDALIVTCFARVRRCHYPTISLVSSSFHCLIASPELYAARSIIGHTESVLYAYVGFPPSQNPSWYILHRKPNRNLHNTVSLRLCKIDSLPPMPWGSAVVTIGSKIYVIGGCVGDKPTSDLTLIDCKSHTCCSLPRMEVARCRAAAGVIDGKIYVVGGCRTRLYSFVEVFDVTKQAWFGFMCPSRPKKVRREFVTYAVMEEKLYMMDDRFCYAYVPKELKWRQLGVNNLRVLWQEPSCVIDDMLFSINLYDLLMDYYPIIVYDPKEKFWRPLRGLEGFPANILLKESKMVNFDGKLVILGTDQSRFCKYDGKKEIWCVEIGLRKEDGEIWGKVESVAVVFTPLKSPSVELCRTVTV